jgi:hypothetical protein
MMLSDVPGRDARCENDAENRVSVGTTENYAQRVGAVIDLLEKCFGPPRESTRIEYIIEDGTLPVRAMRNARTLKESRNRLVVYVDDRRGVFTISMAFSQTDKHASICYFSTPMWNSRFLDLEVTSCLKRM